MDSVPRRALSITDEIEVSSSIHSDVNSKKSGNAECHSSSTQPGDAVKENGEISESFTNDNDDLYHQPENLDDDNEKIMEEKQNDNKEASTSTKRKDNSYTNNNTKKRRKIHDRRIESSEDHYANINRGSYSHPDMQTRHNKIPTPVGNALSSSLSVAADTKATTTKRKVAILLGYLGTNYSGFQMNDYQKTIQSELELALYNNHYIQLYNFGYPQKYSWSTSGRTDKGVHACAQVVSLKMELPEQQNENNGKKKIDKQLQESLDTVRVRLNRTLPSDIQVFDVVRTTRNFCAKTHRDRVRYQYMIPSFLLLHPNKVREIMDPILGNNNDTNNSNNDDDDVSSSTSSDRLTIEQIRSLQKELYSVRATKEQLQLLQNILQVYEGTHSFHNFARRVNANEARASRYIVSFRVEEPIIFHHDNEHPLEWIPTNVIGQSFLLNQIRKMVCLAVDVTRGCLGVTKNADISSGDHTTKNGVEFMKRALKRENDLRLSQAPAQGLFLEMSYYDHYNRKILQTNPELKTFTNWWSATTDVVSSCKQTKESGSKPTITGASDKSDDQLSNNRDEVYQRWNEFRRNVIMKHIDHEEYKEGNFVSYLYNQEYTFNYPYYYGIQDGKCKR